MKPTLAGIPTFVRYLSAFPPADRVAEVLARGPLSHCGARAAMIWHLDGDALSAIGAYGHTATDIDRYGTIPLAVDLPVACAVRDRTVRVDSAGQLPEQVLGSIDRPVLNDLVSRTESVVAVSVPIIYAGTVVGAYGFGAWQHWDPEGSAPQIVQSVASALAIWMTHPRSEIGRSRLDISRAWSLVFTPRQKEVLRLVEAGQSTPAIASSLGVSESSIKADLQQAMRALRTSDRREAARRAASLGLL